MPSVQQKIAATPKAKTAAPAIPAAAKTAAWSGKTSFAGVAPASGGARLDPDRTYKVVTRAVEEGLKKDGSGKKTYTFRMECIEPKEFAGRSSMKTMGDFRNDKGKAFWVTAMLSHGVNRAALEKGDVNVSPAIFVGKAAYLYIGPKKPDGYSDQEFLLPEVGSKKLAEELAHVDTMAGPSGEEEVAVEAAAESEESLFE